jgi:hypothetical protein
MERGVVRHNGSPLMTGNVRVEFVIPGTKTSLNPLKAFQQGLADEPSDRTYDFSRLSEHLCPKCGHLDFFIDLGPEWE